MFQYRTKNFISMMAVLLCLIAAMGYFKWENDKKNPLPVSYARFKSSRYFAKQRQGNKYSIKQRIYDYKNNMIPLSFNISKPAYEKAKKEYGIDFKKCSRYVIDSMNNYVNGQKRKYDLIFNINFTYNQKGAIAWKYTYRARNHNDKNRILKLLNQIKQKVPVFQQRCYKKSGFYLHNNMIYPDFDWLDKRNSKNLQGLFMALYNQAKKKSYGEMDFMGMVLGYCQEIPYVIPPNVVNNKLIIGLYPPTQTVVENRGDCDCKSALFATLWSLYTRRQVVLVRVPGHIFAAVKGRRTFSTDMVITYKGQKYICLEPVGPGKLPIGRVSALSYKHLRAGNFEVHPVY